MSEDRSGYADPPADDSGATAASESTFVLVERAQAGDREALERLMARHLAPLRRWARGRLPQWARDGTDTDDMVQDAMLRTFRSLGTFDARGQGALLGYLRQAIVNRVRDELRRKGRRPDVTDLDAVHLMSRISPLEEAIGREAAERYELALASLTAHEREAIIGRVEMGYSYAELADVLGKPTADAARKAAQRALVRLAEAMNPART